MCVFKNHAFIYFLRPPLWSGTLRMACILPRQATWISLEGRCNVSNEWYLKNRKRLGNSKPFSGEASGARAAQFGHARFRHPFPGTASPFGASSVDPPGVIDVGISPVPITPINSGNSVTTSRSWRIRQKHGKNSVEIIGNCIEMY